MPPWPDAANLIETSSLFHIVASTGRTATSFLAEALNRLPGIVACHEGHAGNDAGPDLLPLVNLENFQVFRDRSRGPAVVGAKRSVEAVQQALEAARRDVLVDVAYYNAMLAEPILEHHPHSRMVGIVRDCESFVRSVTWLAGEDPMPVGWPAPDKQLSSRERFISMGRLRPVEGADLDSWADWSVVERNIWLWRETNRRLLAVGDRWPDRVRILDFAGISAGAAPFVTQVLDGLRLLERPAVADAVDPAVEAASAVNARHGGYQIGERSEWSPRERAMLVAATDEIEGRMQRWRS